MRNNTNVLTHNELLKYVNGLELKANERGYDFAELANASAIIARCKRRAPRCVFANVGDTIVDGFKYEDLDVNGVNVFDIAKFIRTIPVVKGVNITSKVNAWEAWISLNSDLKTLTKGALLAPNAVVNALEEAGLFVQGKVT